MKRRMIALLIVENKSDRDLRVKFEDILTDGKIEGFNASCNVGAHSFARETLFYFDPDSGERQGATFSLRLFEQEQAVLIRRVEDPVRLDP